MRMSAAVIAGQALAEFRGDRPVTVSPLGSRSSKGSRMAHICPELVALLKLMPSMPEYTDADDTPGVPSTMGTTCCTMASVRARLVPGGMVMEIGDVGLVLHGNESARRVLHAPAR